MKTMNEKEYKEKKEELTKTHPDRLLSVNQSFPTNKEKIEAMIAEGKQKGYTILPADGAYGNQAMQGIVLFKEIDNIELAYNPCWRFGEFGVYTKTMIGINCLKTKKDFYMEDVHSISLAAMKAIEDGLKEYGIVLTPEQEDTIYIPMSNEIEKHCDNDYRNHN